MQTLSKHQADFIAAYNNLPVKRVDDLVNSQSPALHMVDKQALCICIAAGIGDYLNFVGLDRKMNDKQMYETAQMMAEEHPHIPVDAIKTFFYQCKKGSFGYHYDEMNGTRILLWFDKFVEDYYKQLDDIEYAKHMSTKGDLANPANLTDEEGEPIDLDELFASFNGKTKEQLQRERLVKEIRMNVYKHNMNLYNSMPVEEADKAIENAIIAEMKAQGLINF